MLAWAALLIANAAVFLAAHELMLRVRVGRFSLDLLLFLLIRLALVSGVVLVALCTSLFSPTALGLAGAATLAALLATGAHRRLPRWRDPGVGPVILALFGLVALRLLAQAWIFAPYVSDVLSYHLPKIAEWVRAGALTRELGGDPRSTFPAGFELVEAWWTVFPHHDALIELAGIEFLGLGAVAAGALARLLGLAPRAAALAALLYALAPAAHLQATAELNDGPVAALYATTAALLFARAPWPLAALAAGMAVGVKPTFVYLSPGLVLLAWLVRARPVAPAASPRIAAALAALGLLLGGFWYARNTVVHGNPVHPMTSRGIVDTNGVVLVPARPNLGNLGWNVHALARRLDDHVGPPSAQQKSMAGWGAGALALGLPALLLFLRRDPSARLLGAGFGLSLVVLLSSISTDPYTMRFALFFAVLLCVAAAWMAERSPVVHALAFVSVALQFLGTFSANEIPDGGIGDWARTPWRDRRGSGLPSVALPADAVGVYHGGSTKGYLLYGPDLGRRVVYLRSADLASLEEELRREGVTIFTAVDSAVVRQGVAEGAFVHDVGCFYRVARRPGD